MTRCRSFGAILGVLALAGMAGACGGHLGPAPAAALPPLAAVVLHPVRAPLERPVDGTIEAINQATLSAQTNGRVAEIMYDVNDVVPAGAVVLRLRSTEQRAGLQAAEASLTEARARNAEAAATYQRFFDMYQRRLVAKAQFDQMTANRDAAAARLTAAEAGATAAQAGVGYTEVRAPYGGVVTRRLVEVGESVSPGTPLMTGLSLRDLRVNTYVPQSIVMQVRRLKKAAVYVGATRVDATRITIFPEAATASSTFRARLDLPPGAIDLSPGMYVRVGLVIGETDQLLVPATAVVERGEVSAVYVLDARDGVSLRYVRPGHRSGDQVEIVAGLTAGERIALDPVAAARRVDGGG